MTPAPMPAPTGTLTYVAPVLRLRGHDSCATPPERDQKAFEAAEHLDGCFGVEDAGPLAKGFAAPGYILGFIEPAESP